MKRTGQFTGILLMLLLACNMSLSAQRGMRGTADSLRMNHMRMAAYSRHQHEMRHIPWMGSRQPFEMRRGFGPMRRDSVLRRPFGPGWMMLESIPNVTEKQKNEITNLNTKQQDDMKKLREEMQTRMKALRDSHRKSVLNILTEEQKKFIESRSVQNAPK